MELEVIVYTMTNPLPLKILNSISLSILNSISLSILNSISLLILNLMIVSIPKETGPPLPPGMHTVQFSIEAMPDSLLKVWAGHALHCSWG
mgnify:CR=1 FL=1